MRAAQENDLVLIIGQDRKQFVVRLKAGGQLQTHRGVVAHDDLLGQSVGREVRSHMGYPFVVLEPSTFDLVQELKRTTQIMFPKDIAYVLMKLNVMPGSRVVEAGTGSGGLALALARAVGPDGRLYSYEARADILRLAEKNLEALGLASNVEFKLRDIGEGLDEQDVDALFLDLRQPSDYLEQAAAALKDGGFFGAILPTTNQVAELIYALEATRTFAHIEVEEILVRPYKAVPGRLRPADRMIAHTGYLVFARKVSREVAQGTYWADRRRLKYEETQRSIEAQADAGEEGAAEGEGDP
ncbi:MAG: tRNA (adenine-N1)-methyltransferase [Anaerolineaceae bacterium]|nr:tRNA (adenine-N1)-methyltransferase [Anaerolineaceae bacterium]